MKLPAAFQFLSDIKAPKLIVEGMKTYGTVEAPGAANNPVILSWAVEVGLTSSYKHDSTAWCGLWMAMVVKRAGYTPVTDPLWAKNWSWWGNEVRRSEAALGDVLVFNRETIVDGKRIVAGHVGVYVGETQDKYAVLGGNQDNRVSIMLIEKRRLVAVRRSPWKVAQPATVQRIVVPADCLSTSKNEA